MKYLVYGALVVLIGAPLSAQELSLFRGQNGSGGDIVVCKPSTENDFDGKYSLDYLLTYRQSNGNADIIEISNTEEYFTYLQGQLNRLHPKMAFAFQEFRRNLMNDVPFRKPRWWREAAFELYDIPDEVIWQKLPSNCKTESGRPNLIQAVVREELTGHVIRYSYNHANVNDLWLNRPLQYTFLIVHEFLWDFFNDVIGIYDVNRLLHSTHLASVTVEDFLSFIKTNGQTNIYADVRILAMGGFWENKTGNCDFTVEFDDEFGLVIRNRDRYCVYISSNNSNGQGYKPFVLVFPDRMEIDFEQDKVQVDGAVFTATRYRRKSGFYGQVLYPQDFYVVVNVEISDLHGGPVPYITVDMLEYSPRRSQVQGKFGRRFDWIIPELPTGN